ncbi:MAG: cupredoxin domain-containing protein [Methanotrichaceae archaeon]
MSLLNLILVSSMWIAVMCLYGCTAFDVSLGEVYPPPPQYVDIINNSFTPNNVTVPLNTTVVWSNHDNTEETVTAADGSFNSSEIPPVGYEFRYIFIQPGWYEYYSRDHSSMTGTVIVKTASGNIPSRPPQLAAKAPKANVIANMTGAAPTPSTNAMGAQSVIIGLIAKNIAYNTSTITAPAGARVTINFDNEDSGIPHNFAVYTDSSATNVIFRGQIITGSKQIAYTFIAPSTPGNYYFRCDVHPTQMYGQFIVTPQ